MEVEEKRLIDWLNDDQVRTNIESILTAVGAIAFVIITKGFINGFTWDLFFSLEPYASGVGVGIATALIQNNMLNRGVGDEIESNKNIQKALEEVEKLDVKITDYDYAEYFIQKYNDSEFKRLQKIETDKAVRQLKYTISIKKSLGRKYDKLQRKLEYVEQYGAKVKNYKRVTLQDLLSFQASNELRGADKINFRPIESQRKAMLRSRIVMFLSSGIMAGLPLSTMNNTTEIALFLATWLPILAITAFRTYNGTRRITKTTYYKSLQYKKNVLQLCVDTHATYVPPKEEEFKKDDIIEIEYKKESD